MIWKHLSCFLFRGQTFLLWKIILFTEINEVSSPWGSNWSRAFPKHWGGGLLFLILCPKLLKSQSFTFFLGEGGFFKFCLSPTTFTLHFHPLVSSFAIFRGTSLQHYVVYPARTIITLNKFTCRNGGLRNTSFDRIWCNWCGNWSDNITAIRHSM